MEMMESTMVTFTSAAARSVFGSVKDSGQDRHNAGSMIQDNIVCILSSLVGEIVDRQDKRQHQDHDEV